MAVDYLDEWKSLRDEVARKQDFSERLILTTAAGSFAIYAFAAKDLKPENAPIALLPIFIATMAYLWLLRNMSSVQRIETYLMAKNANMTPLSWIEWIHDARKKLDDFDWEDQDDKEFDKEKIAFFERLKRGIKDTKFYKLVYIAFYIVSAIVFLFILWGPYILGTASSSMSIGARSGLTGLVTLIAILWYFLSHIAWIRGHEAYAKEKNIQLQKLAHHIKNNNQNSEEE